MLSDERFSTSLIQSPGMLMCLHGKQAWLYEEYRLFRIGMHDGEGAVFGPLFLKMDKQA